MSRRDLSASRDRRVLAALGQVSTRVGRRSPARFDLELVNGSRLVAEAALEDEWLELRAPMPKLRSGLALDPWAHLTRLAGLEGPARLVAEHAEPAAPELRAEIRLDEGDLEGAVRRAVASLLDAALDVRKSSSETGTEDAEVTGDQPIPETPPASPAPATGDAGELAELCREAGWSSEGRDADGARVVDLGCRRGFFQARVAAQGISPDGGLHLSASLVRGGIPDESARRSVAAYLLAAVSAVRWVRPVARQDDPPTPELEIALPPGTGAKRLGDALAALAGACDLLGPECRCLATADLANRYLDVRGWSAGITTDHRRSITSKGARHGQRSRRTSQPSRQGRLGSEGGLPA